MLKISSNRIAGGIVTGVLFFALAPGTPARSAAPVHLRANFDNAYIYSQGAGERYLEIEVVVPGGVVRPEDYPRPPLNIALVLDTSGSMAAANKIGFVKDAARAMIDRLRYGDRFALVAYDDLARVLLPSEALEDRTRAKAIIDRLSPGGSTNLGAGLLEGYRQGRRYYLPEGINRVLLLSDGLANRGITSPRELSRIATGEAGGGISLTTFGVGQDFNEDLLASMSESGRGTYYYIDQAYRIPEMLAREFSLLQRVAAVDVVITIVVRGQIVVSDILGYEFRREGDRYHVHLGSLAAGERRRLMARVTAPQMSAGTHRVGEVRMKYRPAGEKREATSSQELQLHFVNDLATVSGNLNREVSERSAVFEANSARRKAASLVDRGDLDGAKKVLLDSRERLEAAPVQSEAVRDELEENDAYGSAIAEPLSAPERSAIQKGVKYRSYQILQSR